MPRFAPPAPRRDAYTGMLALTCFSMIVGILVLALEANEYDWESQPKGGPSISLPAKSAPAAPAAN